MGIGLSLVNGQLLTSIFQTVHFHVSTKSKFICSVLTFHLSIVMRCSNPDAMIFDAGGVRQIRIIFDGVLDGIILGDQGNIAVRHKIIVRVVFSSSIRFLPVGIIAFLLRRVGNRGSFALFYLLRAVIRASGRSTAVRIEGHSPCIYVFGSNIKRIIRCARKAGIIT